MVLLPCGSCCGCGSVLPFEFSGAFPTFTKPIEHVVVKLTFPDIEDAYFFINANNCPACQSNADYQMVWSDRTALPQWAYGVYYQRPKSGEYVLTSSDSCTSGDQCFGFRGSGVGLNVTVYSTAYGDCYIPGLQSRQSDGKWSFSIGLNNPTEIARSATPNGTITNTIAPITLQELKNAANTITPLSFYYNQTFVSNVCQKCFKRNIPAEDRLVSQERDFPIYHIGRCYGFFWETGQPDPGIWPLPNHVIDISAKSGETEKLYYTGEPYPEYRFDQNPGGLTFNVRSFCGADPSSFINWFANRLTQTSARDSCNKNMGAVWGGQTAVQVCGPLSPSLVISQGSGGASSRQDLSFSLDSIVLHYEDGDVLELL